MDIIDQLPTTDKDFIKNDDPSKNATKIEVDMEKNAPFIKELQQKIAACNDPEVAKKMEDEFEAATGISFDDALKAAETGEVITIENPDGSLTMEKRPVATSTPNEDTPPAHEETCATCNIFGGSQPNEDTSEKRTVTSGYMREEPLNPEPESKVTTTNDSGNTEESPIADEAPSPKGRGSSEPVQWDDEAPINGIKTGPIEAADNSETIETGEEAVDPEEMKLLAEVLSKLDEYKAHPEKLKMGQDAIDLLAQNGVFGDREMVTQIVEAHNADVDELINHDNPESMYHDEEVYTNAVKDSLAIKISYEQAAESIRGITDPLFIQELFGAKYPDYVEHGPASIINKFKVYLQKRLANETESNNLCSELMSKKKIANIIKNANDQIFKHLKTRDGKGFSLPAFVQTIFTSTREYTKTIVGIDDAKDVTFEHAESLITIFSILFLRYVYKNLVDNLGSRKLQKKYLLGFLFDITNPKSLSEQKRAELDSAWTETWKLIADVEANLVKIEQETGITEVK